MDREVEIRRNAGLSALVGVLASGLAIAYLWRVSQTGAAWDWVLLVVMTAIGFVQLSALVDARTPLLIADTLGVRIRLGHEWRGLPWGALEQVVVEERDSWLRDGRLVLSPRNLGSALEDLDTGGRRQVAWLQRLYGAPLALPLGLTTRTSSDDLVADLSELADGRTEVVVLGGRDLAALDLAEHPTIAEPEPLPEPEPDEPTRTTFDGTQDAPDPHANLRRTRVVGGLGMLVSRVGKGQSHDVDSTEPAPLAPAASFDPVQPLRGIRRALRAEVSRETPSSLDGRGPDGTTMGPTMGTAALDLEPLRQPLPEDRELRRRPEPEADSGPDSGRLDQVVQAGGNVRPIARLGDSVEPLVIDGFVTEPAFDPVIGPEITAARTRAGLSIDQLSERTRIRPHVLECIEVDDFGPCGGDFYARGHLRTLTRVLGLDAVSILEDFDARYAHAPINARRVFEAELATGMNGGMRATSGGPRWSLLVGAVLCLLMVWGVARFFTADPTEVASPSPVVSDSAGLAASQQPITSPLMTTKTLTVTATRGAARVVVRDRTGRIVWSGHLAEGAQHKVAGLAPFSVSSSDASAVDVRLMGRLLGAVGAAGKAGSKSFH